MKCPICGKDLDLQNKQIGTSENGDPIFNEYAICHSCKKQWNLDKQRAKKIAEIKSRCGGLNELLTQNSELLTAEVEQALLRAATGYTVTEHTIKYVNGVKTTETRERHISPSQAAIEFYLINKKGEDYSRNGGGSGNAEGALADILEALKNG